MVNRLTALIAGDEAAATNARLNLSYCYITSPIQGRVGLRLVDPGNMVRAGDATGIVSIAQLHPISVLFTLPQDSLPRISLAMAAGQLPVVAFAADDKTELDQGVLLTPDNAIDTSHRHDQAEGHLPQPAQHAVAWPVRQCAAAAGHRPGRADRAVRRGAARPGRALRLCRQAGFDGGAPARRGRP